ncbi:MAG: MBL fold metallo-hydrolase [Synechococcales bacterium]|nr:MBL fold metallo-hydrolase [Synechococcales bacterium]
MKRRQLLGYMGAGTLAAIGTSVTGDRAAAQAGGVTVQALGHMSFLFTGSGQRILSNPFRPLGCTAGMAAPKMTADLVMISSQLLDEGAIDLVPGNPQLLYEPGAYDVKGIKFQGISMDHDRKGGRQFGINVAWRWTQGGVTILHLGGAAAPISLEQKILMGSPDIVLIPVGGGAKAYNPQQAKDAIKVLNPKIIVPTQYRTAAAKDRCDLVAVDQFLKLMEGTPVSRPGKSISWATTSLPKSGMVIQVLG